MSSTYHSPIVDGASNAAATWNNPMGQLDAAIAAASAAFAAGDTSLQDEIDALIIEAGTSDAETIAARTAIPYVAGTPPTTLGEALGYTAGDIANVLAFGADNTGASDSSTAVTAALAATDIVYFPPGTYLFNATVSTGSDKRIYGNGATLKVGTATPLDIDGDNVVVEGLIFQGVATDHTTRATGGTGMTIDATAARRNIKLRGCTFEWLQIGVHFTSPSPGDNTITLRNLAFEGCTFRDIMMRAVSLTLSPGGTEGSNYNVRRWRIAHCDFEDTYAADLSADSDSCIYLAGGMTVEDMAISGCTFRNSSVSFLRCNSGNGTTGMATLKRCAISGCTFDGQPSSGTTWYTSMGLDLAYTTDLAVSGCTFRNIKIEGIATFEAQHFAVSGCTFSKCGYGVGVYSTPTATKPATGTITGCTFVDMADPETNSRAYGIVLAKGSASAVLLAHRVKIANCTFDKGAETAGTLQGIRLQDTSYPATVVSGCDFYDLSRGIYLADVIDHTITVQGCTFDGCATAAIEAGGKLAQSTIANCAFTDCAIDITAVTSEYVRCVGNIHDGTTGHAIRLQNSLWISVTNSIFTDVAIVQSGTGTTGSAHPTIWQNNIYAGTTTKNATDLSFCTLNQQGHRTIYVANMASNPVGTWVVGDVAIDVSPLTGQAYAWVCTVAGTDAGATWKAIMTVA